MNKEIVERYLSGCNLRTLAKECGVGENRLSKDLKNAGILRPRGAVTRHTYDDHVFDRITEQSAYWMGFLMADGSVTKHRTQKTRYLSLLLSVKDIAHIEKFKQYMKASYPVVRRANTGFSTNETASIKLTASDHLVEALAKHGVIQNKTLEATASKELESNNHFWRGVVDGDGWISIHPPRNLPCIGMVGSKNLCDQFAGFARTITPECTSNVFERTANCSQFQTTGIHAQRLIETLYANCEIALDRKLALARRWIENPFVVREQKHDNKGRFVNHLPPYETPFEILS